MTPSGIPVKALYGPEDVQPELIGDPGAYPFTRGIDPELYRAAPWIMGMYSGYASPERTNRRIRKLLKSGGTGFSIALDLPTQVGLDSDAPLAAGEVGKVGVPICSLQDLERLLDGIQLGSVRQIRTTANSIGPVIAAYFIALAERRGVRPSDFRVMFQNDSLKEYVARGTYIFPPARALRFSADLVEYACRHVPGWEPIELCGYHVRDSGCTAAQEIAIALANGVAYIEEVLRRGVHIDEFAGSLVMFLSSDIYIFEEVAKFRAARRIWARLMRDRYGAQAAQSTRLQIFCYTLGGSLTAQQPMNNLVRVAYEALAAALGGVQTLATSAYDEALSLPSPEAATLALRTQQVLAFETGVCDTVDPLGGSFFVESLTDELERAITAEFESIQAHGGAVAAIENRYLETAIGESAFRAQIAVETGQQVKVGVNRFQARGRRKRLRARGLELSAQVADRQITSLQALRRMRDRNSWRQSVRALRADAKAGRNLVPILVEAAKNYVTVGECCDVLRDLWGTYQPQRVVL